jgi:hemolysin D
LAIAFLEKGQPVYLKFDAYPAERYALGHGVIRDISADTISATDKTWAYVFRVSLTSKVLNALKGDIPIVSGMTATVDIVTGKRRVISYLFEPIERSMMNGARER